jgi:hypothetical protein
MSERLLNLLPDVATVALVEYVLLLHGGNPLDEVLVAAAGAVFLIGGWMAIRLAPSPEASDERPAEGQDSPAESISEQR